MWILVITAGCLFGQPGCAAQQTTPGFATLQACQYAGRTEVLRLQDAITAVSRCPKPVIATVHGYCIGGGVDLIAACDVRLASADAVFSVREAKMAIIADLGSLQRLPAIIGPGHLAELAYTGKDITAERAKEIGLLNDVTTDAEGVLKARCLTRKALPDASQKG